MRLIRNQQDLYEVIETLSSDHLCLNDTRVIGVTISPDDLKGSNIISNLSHGSFTNVVFEGIKLSYADCYHAEFMNVKFKNCTFGEALNFIKCDFTDTTFESCTISSTEMNMCSFENSSFKYCTFTSMSLSRAIIISRSDIELGLRHFFRRGKLSKSKVPPSAFFDHCYFQNSAKMSDCTIHTAGLSTSLISCQEDLKRISWINIGCVIECNPKFITVGPIGSRDGYTTYIPCIDWVQCGCWKVDECSKEYGGSLDAFERRVNQKYPEGKYHDDYMAAIQFFKVARKKYISENPDKVESEVI